jgi:DNA primase
MRQAIDDIKAAITVDDYAGRYLDIRRGVALCPFHKEKTPSFRVYERYWKCHGCQAGGDLIEFARCFHGISIGAAIHRLAEEAGVELTEQPKRKPYDVAKEQRIIAEAEEWRRQVRTRARNWPATELLLAMSKRDLVEAYKLHRTPELGAEMRVVMRDADLWVKAMTPLVDTLVDRLASAPESQFPDWQYGERCW